MGWYHHLALAISFVVSSTVQDQDRVVQIGFGQGKSKSGNEHKKIIHLAAEAVGQQNDARNKREIKNANPMEYRIDSFDHNDSEVNSYEQGYSEEDDNHRGDHGEAEFLLALDSAFLDKIGKIKKIKDKIFRLWLKILGKKRKLLFTLWLKKKAEKFDKEGSVLYIENMSHKHGNNKEERESLPAAVEYDNDEFDLDEEHLDLFFIDKLDKAKEKLLKSWVTMLDKKRKILFKMWSKKYWKKDEEDKEKTLYVETTKVFHEYDEQLHSKYSDV